MRTELALFIARLQDVVKKLAEGQKEVRVVLAALVVESAETKRRLDALEEVLTAPNPIDNIPTPAEVRVRLRGTASDEASAIIQALAKELREGKRTVGNVWVSGVPSGPVRHEVGDRMRAKGWDVTILRSIPSRKETQWAFEPSSHYPGK